MTQLRSRTPDIDIDKCAENVGGKMELILIAAQRARDLRSKHKRQNNGEHVNFATEALLEIQAGTVDANYNTERHLEELRDDTDVV